MNKKIDITIVICILCILVVLGAWWLLVDNQHKIEPVPNLQFHVVCDSISYTDDDVWDACWVLSNNVTMLRTTDIERGRICRGVAEACKVYPDPYLLFAMIYTESSYRPDVVNSYSNAQGLMQILPSTLDVIVASLLGGHFDVGYAQVDSIRILEATEDIKVIECNILFGTIYLKYLLDRYGNLEEALSHYGGYDAKFSPYSKKVLLKREEYLKEFDIGRMEQFKKEKAQEKIIT